MNIINENNNYMNDFESNEIRVLDAVTSLRTRSGMFVGSTDGPEGASILLREVIDNCIDECFLIPYANRILIQEDFNGIYNLVCDNSRGMPIQISPEYGVTMTELAITKLNAGSKFDNSKKSSSTGQNGVGITAANCLSESYIMITKITENNYDKSIKEVYDAWINSGPRQRKDLYYIIATEKGIKVFEGAERLKDLSSRIFGHIPGYIELPQGYSTLVLFRPDPEIWKSTKVKIPYKNLEYFLLIEKKFFKKNIEVIANGQLLGDTFEAYQFEFTKKIIPSDPSKNGEISFYVNFEVDPDLSPKVLEGSVNSLVSEGVHLQYIENQFEIALRSEFGITHKCVTNGLKLRVVVLCGESVFDSQTKTRLRSLPGLSPKTDLVPIAKEFVKIFRANQDYWRLHVDKLNYLADSLKQLSSIDKSKALVTTNNSSYFKIKTQLSDKLADATAPRNERHKCLLYIVEGDSAGSSLKRGRPSSLYYAVMPLRGRVKNVDGLSTDEMLANAEFKTLFQAIGLGTNEYNPVMDIVDPVERMNVLKNTGRYGGVVVATDSDADGSIIAAQVIYCIYKFATFLIEAGMIYLADSPTFSQDGKYYYASDPTIDGEIPVGIDTSRKYLRYKGLGSLDANDVTKVFFDENTRRFIQVTPEGAEYACSLVESLEDRKNLLQAHKILTNPFNLK